MNARNPAGNRTSTLTVRVPSHLKKRLDGLARTTGRNRSRVAVDALESYVEEREEQLAGIDQGIRDADAGRVISHDKVKRYLQSWGKKRKLPPPSCE
jgi:RHH-type transcriptional regulator, rel operon repressor / antitoxin RelB